MAIVMPFQAIVMPLTSHSHARGNAKAKHCHAIAMSMHHCRHNDAPSNDKSPQEVFTKTSCPR